MNIGDTKELTKEQASIIFGWPYDKIQSGVRASWSGTEVEIFNTNGDTVQIRRVAAGWDSISQGETPNSPGSTDFHELDSFSDGAATETDRDGGLITRPKLGLIEVKILNPGQAKGGEGQDVIEVCGPSAQPVTPRPGFPITNPAFGVPALNQTALASIDWMANLKTLIKAEKSNKPLMAVKEGGK